MSETDLTMGRIERLLGEIEATADPASLGRARDLAAALLDLQRLALSRVLSIVGGAGAPGVAIAETLARDDLLASLLDLHGLAAPRGAPQGLVQIRIPKASASEPPAQRCDLCGAALSREHPHLLEPATRALSCACLACALLFDRGGADQRLRRVPDRVRRLDDFRMTDAGWSALGVPVNLAFFFRSTRRGQVMALYPGPGGAVESELSPGAWDDLVRDNPALAQMEPDVEALLAHRIGAAREHFLLPIDRCFELTGLCREQRRSLLGLGRDPADGEIAAFFERIRAEARPAG